MSDLVAVYRQWLEAPAWQRDELAQRMAQAAVQEFAASLPPAGPSPVECEVQELFASEDVQAFAPRRPHVRLINGEPFSRGRSVKRRK